MITSPFRNRLVPLALTSAALLFSENCLSAQTVAPVPGSRAVDDESIMLEKFLVTGSAVPVIRGESFHPVFEMQREDFERAGAATPVEGLRTIPGFFGEAGTELRSNGGTGAARVNIRGLGGTLTLLDGHRTAGFDEVNLLPSIALAGAEVVMDGTGARYGADALMGVVNLRLVPSFQGRKIDFFYGNTTNEDAGVLRAGVLVGGGNARTNIVVGLESYHRNALMATDRDVSADADGRSRGGMNLRDAQVSSEFVAARPGDTAYGFLVLPQGLEAGYLASTFVRFDTNPDTSGQFYNSRQITPSIPEQENKSIYARINHSILKEGRLEAHARLLYTENRYESSVWTTAFPVSGAQLRGSPHRPTGLIMLPTSFDTQAVAFLRPDSIGPRGRRFERDVYDFQFGLKGRLDGTWSWDTTYVYSWWYRDDTQSNALDVASLRSAIASGAYNLFALDSAAEVNPNNLRAFDNPAALRAAAVTGRIDHDFGVRGVDARIGGSVVTLPAGPIEIAGGFDFYRTEQSSAPDSKITAGLATYFGFNATGFSSAEFTSQGAFAEVVVPVLAPKMAIPFARVLSFSGSVRRSEKEVSGAVGNGSAIKERTFKATSPKVGVRFAPFTDLTFRSSYAEGFRTPGLSSMYAAQSTGSLGLVDPLGFPIATTTAVTTQGNPDLEAESSETWSTSVVYEPRVVRGLRMQAEYYDSHIDNMIADGAQLFLNINATSQGPGFVRGNASTINPNAAFAKAITRSASGTVTGVLSSPVNTVGRHATGIDYSLSYDWPIVTTAKLMTRIEANTTLSWTLRTAQNAPDQNWLGRFVDVGSNSISPGSIPRHRGRFIQGWEKKSWSLHGVVNHVGKLEDDRGRTYLGRFRHIASWTTFDAQLTYQLKTEHVVLRGVKLRLGVTNLFDKAAPFAAGAFNDGYDVTLHSNRGRFIYTQVTKTF